MIAVLVVHGLIALFCLLFGRRLGRKSLLLGVLGPLSTLLVLIRAMDGGWTDLSESIAWIPAIGFDLVFVLDGFSALMVGLIGGVGVLVFVFAWFYLGNIDDLGRFTAYLVVFAGSMFGLVTADNLLLLFTFWELTSVMSYLLIGFKDESAGARASALQALLVTGVGGLAMLAGLVLVAQAGGTYSMSELLAQPPTGTSVTVGLVLILVGAFAKSAQFPLHFWLPGAMTAPTPVSAYLHSATMVKAGIYVIARFAPVYATLMPWWRPTVVVVGVTTMLVGGWRALAQFDLKLLLAQGTVSQLGFIVVLVGWGSPAMTFAGMAMILAHGVFKAALFMVAGTIDREARTRDLRGLSGLRHKAPVIFGVSLISVASMAGLPPLLGFISKETALEALLADTPLVVPVAIVVGSILTTAYGIRFIWGAFLTKTGYHEDFDVVSEVDPGVGVQVPSVILAVATVVWGLFPSLVNELVVAAAQAVGTVSITSYLALWHGFNWALLLSAVALGGGWMLWRLQLEPLRRITSKVPTAPHVYGLILGAVNRVADRTTAIFQSGSLPVYLLIILSVAVLAPGVLLVIHWRQLPDLVMADSAMQIVTAVLVVGSAVGAARTRRRVGAILFLAGAGYGVAVLFVTHGAPDLAITQLLVETLTISIFILVLSRLPGRFALSQTRIRQVTRILVSVGVGMMAVVMSLWAVSERVAPSLAPEYLARSVPEGGGSNVVNVILTDFRALDTLGEITVLVLVGLGVISVIRAHLTDEAKRDLEAER